MEPCGDMARSPFFVKGIICRFSTVTIVVRFVRAHAVNTMLLYNVNGPVSDALMLHGTFKPPRVKLIPM